MRVVFMGSPEFSVPTLEMLINSKHEVVCVYSQPPRPAGRGKKPRPTAIHARAEEAGLEVRTPLNFKAETDVEAFEALDADLAVVVAYGLILPQKILDAPKLGCVNLHASLLPRWRGAAPIHRAILSGDCETGVCLMQMEAGLDTGPVLARVETPIGTCERTPELHNRLAKIGADLLEQNIDHIEDLKAVPQSEDGVSYASKIDKSEAKIDWSQEAFLVQRQIHALCPFPGAWSTFDGERFKFHKVEIVEAEGNVGQILDNQMTIACGKSAIRPIELQREGKKIMPIADVLRGFQGDILGKEFR